ncbi:MAG: tetratricopeptide repeat protein [Gemmatimonadales bacterium]|nr:tetratricopeptide repeat protein [Gemmatimonadales bacterium]
MGDPVKAVELWQRAYRLQAGGDHEGAIRLYQASIAEHPTAEAHTYLGWVYSFQKRFDEAIAECKRAIACDPDFGNPYNDIGVYLMELGRDEEAVPWLVRATGAKRYEPRHFPHLNLARIYERRGDVLGVVRALGRALDFAPEDRSLRTRFRRMQGMVN